MEPSKLPGRAVAVPLLILALAAAGTAWAARPGASRAPNILVILADDLGRGDYSAFGTPDIRTPGIDRLVAEGAEFSDFYANCPVCSPTRAALLTGRYPDRVGVPGVIRQWPENCWGYLDPAARLLPAELRRRGYDTAMVGKWHLGYAAPNTPLDRGFEEFRGFLGDMMDDYWTHRRGGENFMRWGRQVVDPPGHATELFTRWAQEYLESRSGQRSPFFLYVAYNAPHDPIQPPEDRAEAVRRRSPAVAGERARLVALIEHMDDGIATLLETLDRTGLGRNTLVVFTSDNGGVLRYGAVNGPWRGEKQQMYEGGLRVPCVVRWPGRIAPGRKISGPALTMDLFPTLLQAAGKAPRGPVDGVSLLPALSDPGVALPDRDLYFVRREGGPAYGGATIDALRRGRWKLVRNSPFKPLELFDLQQDPRETTDLSTRQPAVFRELSTALEAHRQAGGRTPWQPPDLTVARFLEPGRGDRWAVGSTHRVTWSGRRQGRVVLDLSPDDGRTWERRAEAPAASGRLSLEIPEGTTSRCRLRLVFGGGQVAVSDRFALVPSQEQPGYRWETMHDSAPFAPRDGAGLLSHKGRLWLLGGWNPGDRRHFPRICNNEVWSSSDGRDWRLDRPNSFLDTTFDGARDWEGRHTAGYVTHRGRMWIVGGDVNQGHYQDDVWTSEDGRSWTRVNSRVPWGPRALHHTLVHRDRIWVLGGQTVPQFAPAAQRFHRDAWTSADGVAWDRVRPAEPFWSARGMIGGAAVLGGRIWILGGGTYDTPSRPLREFHNDVWSSSDGRSWTRHTASAPWAPRQYHEVAAWDGRLWVLEGYGGEGSPANRNDVWYSSDGENWYQLKGTPWRPRHAASVAVHAGALWLVAGNNMQSDVWRLVREARGARAVMGIGSQPRRGSSNREPQPVPVQ